MGMGEATGSRHLLFGSHRTILRRPQGLLCSSLKPQGPEQAVRWPALQGGAPP